MKFIIKDFNIYIGKCDVIKFSNMDWGWVEKIKSLF